ncbi:MAG: ATP-binding cassette domain-containing protein [Treponema sp.]|jgi:ABC-type lipoprotein export system ATPase subunit|nr:ATP-binding cassette domain-containing protein [Treponema sp.]
MKGIIALENVSFAAQNIRIIHDVTLEIDEGKTTALVGASGSGKSTLLKLCAGLLIPSSGRVYFRGKDISAMNRAQTMDFRRESAFVFQDSALWANQSLFQSLELPLRIHFPGMASAERENRIQSVLRDVGYKRDLSIRPASLSMGEQKLIAFARAMMCRPRLLFLDEWTESLDDSAAQRLIQLVERMQKENDTVILVSHDFRIVRNLADYVLMILGGRFFLKLSREQMEDDEDLARYVERGIAS